MEKDDVGLDAQRSEPPDGILQALEETRVEPGEVEGAIVACGNGYRSGSLELYTIDFGKTVMRILLNGPSLSVRRVAFRTSCGWWSHA
ncbi:hypothetical protein [Actinomadura sp. CNU-125]|uniref:hypothetical protein n=1 Tax=Actinomadura sp. CNU-125 TaxID=1904961 RepID=UPI0021CC532E|nr:hypothetical protein [Actinomadura sp. CNU-125]